MGRYENDAKRLPPKILFWDQLSDGFWIRSYLWIVQPFPTLFIPNSYPNSLAPNAHKMGSLIRNAQGYKNSRCQTQSRRIKRKNFRYFVYFLFLFLELKFVVQASRNPANKVSILIYVL